jgi:hypothetical protein
MRLPAFGGTLFEMGTIHRRGRFLGRHRLGGVGRWAGLLTSLTGSVVAIGLVLPGAIAAEATGSAKANCTWSVDKRPKGSVNAVAADAHGVWAAGSIGKGAVLRFDGARWRSIPVPGVSEIVDLAVGGGSVWALAPPRVHRWTGTRWQRFVVTGLPKARHGLSFSAIDAGVGGDVWLAGTYDDSAYGPNSVMGSGWLTAVLHAGRWRTYRGGGGSYAGLTGVASSGASDAWAVGGQGPTLASAQEVMLHWNGSRWIDMSRYDYVMRLSDVLVLAPGDAWAVGETNLDAFPESRRRSAIEHWDGTRWLRVETANWHWPTAPTLNALAAFGRRDVWAGGSRWNGPPALLHWDGEHWSEAAPPPVTTAILDLAAGRDGTLWAVGEGFVAHFSCR